jgi:class 3 adenylate cyclase/DNA-binding NarL/FixJ family response regulator
MIYTVRDAQYEAYNVTKILVVEDTPDFRQILGEVLRFGDYDVVEARDGLEGLELAREHLPDLIISDVMMPRLDGFGMLAELRSEPLTQTIPLIFLTAKDDYESWRTGMHIGADDYLMKPISPQVLLEAVEGRLRKHRFFLDSISRQIEELGLLRRIDRELMRRLNPDWVITITMDWALRKTKARTAILGTIEDDSPNLMLRYAHSQLTEDPPQIGQRWPLDGPIGQIIRSAQPTIVNDVRESGQAAPVDSTALAWLGLPLSTEERVVGAILVETDQAGIFTPDVINFVSQLANRTIIVLEQVHLVEQLTRQHLEQLELREMFGRFVSPNVADTIRAGGVRLEGENRPVSVLFTDIRGFTTFSERHSPQQVVALLNEYLPLVVRAAQMHEGTVNKFGGDSTLVIYGAPTPLPDHAYQAVLTALQLRTNLEHLNRRRAERGDTAIRIGVGINTGEAIAGAIGPRERQEYTVIGDTVNLASRIEALTKTYPDHDILISDFTYQQLGDRRIEFAFADLGAQDIRGKSEPVRIWSVLKQLKKS